jgi:uncharacterized protein with HEPN domain
MRDDHARLLDIQEAIERIEKYAGQGRAVFEQDDLIQNWMVQHLQIIGEAARALSDNFRAAHPEVPWSDIIGMRTILVHKYFEIDLDAVWSAVEQDVPNLKPKVQAILSALEEADDISKEAEDKE